MNSMRAVGRFPAFESSVPSGPSGLTTDQVDRATETANVSRMDLTKKKNRTHRMDRTAHVSRMSRVLLWIKEGTPRGTY